MTELLELAYCTRRWAERNRHRHNFGSDLHGMCAIASAHLYRVLKDSGIKTQLAVTEDHVHLQRGGMVLDITATQFGDFPPVLYTPLRKLLSHGSAWEGASICEDLEQLNLALKGWPPYQTPTIMWDDEFIKNPREYHA